MLAKLSNLFPLNLLSADAKRRRLCKQAPEGALKEYLATPFPDLDKAINEHDILAVDFETTGLNAKKDQLLSVGFVNIHHGSIQLNTAFHQVIRTKGQLKKDNVIVHSITDQEKERGAELKTAIDNLLLAMAGKVVLVHFAQIERNFLRQGCKEIYGCDIVFPILDTLAIAKRRFDMSDVGYDPSKLRLANLRTSYALPDFRAHNALNDAIATAELFLAETKVHHQGNKTKLKPLIS